jgi:anaerobic magnesium-protoporphyrin IX monomethyl ester cyclase
LTSGSMSEHQLRGEGPVAARLLNRQQDAVLPLESPLRRYLEGKPESSRISVDAAARNVVPFRAKIPRNALVSLVMPPCCFSKGAIKRVMPPLGLMLLSSCLKAAGFFTDLVDCVVEAPSTEVLQPHGLIAVGMPVKDAALRILSTRPGVVCVSVLYSCDVAICLELCAALRRHGFAGPIVVGGIHASIYPADLLGKRCAASEHALPPVDFVVRGEGESRLPALLGDLADGLFDLHADGLCGNADTGEIFENPQIGQIEHLDALPLPDYTALDLERYFALNLPFSPVPRGSRVAQILTSRGCPVGCTFCASTNFSRRYRARSIASVIAEIKFLKERYAIDEVQFADDNLTLHPPRALELANALRPLDIAWCTPNGIMINTLDDALIDAMASSGLYQVTLSFDGGNASTLRAKHRKPVDLDRGIRSAERFKDLGVLVHATLVIGMPGETCDDILDAFEFFLTLPIQSVAVFFAQPLPGSELYERLLAAGRIDAQTARVVDTSRPAPGVSEIAPDELLRLADGFLETFNRNVLLRYPDLYRKKYEGHSTRLLQWIVGGEPNQNFRNIVLDNL